MVSKDAKAVKMLLRLFIDELDRYCEEASRKESEIFVPISGGLDSSLLLLLTSKTKECKHIHAIHVNMGNPKEFALSKLIANKVGVPIHVILVPLSYLKNNLVDMLSKLVRLIGYPRERDSSLPYLILALFMKSHHSKRVLFSIGGDDADTIFGGYDYYKLFATQLILEKRNR